MRALRAAAILALLLAGCGGSWSGTFDLGPGAKEFSLVAWRGKIRLRNGAPGAVEVSIRGDAPIPLDRVVLRSSGGSAPGLRVDEAAKDAALELEIAVPKGVALTCGCSDADVEVTGSWSRLVVRTAGAIDARVDHVDSGTLESQSGAVLYSAATGPAGEIRARSIRGDVSVRIPASWNGQIQARTASGKLDVPPHEGRLVTLWDEDRKGVIGHVGPPRKEGEPLAMVWGESSTGIVSLRLEE